MTFRVLVAHSAGAPAELIAPVVAALAAEELDARRVDLGRLSLTGSKTIDRVVGAILGEGERRLEQELAGFTPDVAVAFDPAAAGALCGLRDRRVSPAPVVAVVSELAPRRAWLCDADRYVVLDDEAAVALSDLGVDGARVVVGGPLVPQARAAAAKEAKAALRERFKIPADAAILLLDAKGLGAETISQVVLQLALFERRVFTLFDAGDDAQAAAQLRRQVPSLGLRGKLFGAIPDAPLLWRAADVVIGRARPAGIHAALAAGCAYAMLEPRGDDLAEAQALAERRLGGGVSQALLLAASLEPLLGRGGRDTTGADGAAEIARLCAAVAADREAVLAETFTAARERGEAARQVDAEDRHVQQRREAAAGDLEDLGGDDDDAPSAGAPPPRGPDHATLQRLRAEVAVAEARARKELDTARDEAEKWDQRRVMAERKGDAQLAADAAREADRKRARMHVALEELQRVAAERKRLDGLSPAPSSVDDALHEMKRESARTKGTVDDELDALKKKMAQEKPKR